MISGGDGEIVGRAVIVGDVVVVEGRHRQQHLGIERVDPGEIQQSIGFVIAITETDAGILPIYQIVLNVVGKGIVRNLLVVLAQRGHEAQLIGRIGVENERPETAVPIGRIVYHF